MKSTHLFDLLFIAVCVALAFILSELDYSYVFDRYAVLFLLAAYHIGKFVKGLEYGKKVEPPQANNG